MPKRVSEDELMEVFAAVASLARPVSLEEITERLTTPVPRRTLQRRLAMLAGKGRLAARSTRGGRRYQVGDGTPLPVSPTPAGVDEIPLSLAGRDIRRSVTRATPARKSVGYHAAFLEFYRPNASAYLPTDLRRRLAEMGRTSGVPRPAGTYFRKEMKRLLIDLAWNSSRLAGNSHSLEETQRLFDFGERAEGKKAGEIQMLLNHRAAIEWLAQQAGEIGFDRYTLCNFHALLSDHLLPEPAAGGRLRTHALAIGGTVFHPLSAAPAIETRFEQILTKAAAIGDPFEAAFFALVHLSYLQPFESMNQRVARLAANLPLIQSNFIPLSFVDVPHGDFANAVLGVYELNRVDCLRDVFVWAYERSCTRYSAIRKSLGEPDPFRLRHGQLLVDVIGEIVRGGMVSQAARTFIRQQAETLPDPDEHELFAEMAETELSAIHQGNLARYRLRPSEFDAWKQAAPMLGV